MKLLTEKGQMAIPDDFSFEIRKSSPFFSTEGEQSIPVSIPASQHNLSLLGHPERIAGTASALRRIDAQLISGIIHKGGQLVFDSVSKDGIEAALALAESDLYAKNKDKSIRELFADVYRNDYSSEADIQAKVAAWATHLYNVFLGSENDVFTVFPVFSDKLDEEEDGIFIFNRPLFSPILEGHTYGLKYLGRRVRTKDGYDMVPDGYGISPFLFLHSFISLLFTQLGYTVGTNFFDSEPYDKLVLLNNNADTICPGKICYGDIVPSCTVSEFIDWLEAKFHCTVIVDNASKVVDIISMEDIITGNWDLDLSNMVDGAPKISISDPSHVVLSSDTSIDGVAPPEPTLQDFKKKYKVLTELDEEIFTSHSGAQSKYIILRRATGVFYLRRLSVNGGANELCAIGSNTFTYDRKNNNREHAMTAVDIIPLMVEKQVGGTTTNKIVGPYLGERVSRNTGYYENKDETAGNEQKIMVVFDAGDAGTDASHTLQYRLGTTQKYNNLGLEWNAWGLTTEDLYNQFWKRYNELIMNCSTKLTAKVDFTPDQLQHLRLDLMKRYKGVKLLPIDIGYSVGSDILCGESNFLIVKEVDNPIVDSLIVIPGETFKWVYYDDLQSKFSEWMHARNDWEPGSPFSEYITPASEDYRFLPPATEEGVIGCRFTRKALFSGWTDGVATGRLIEEEVDINCWYESAPIE